MALFTKILTIDFDLKRKRTILFLFTKTLTRILTCKICRNSTRPFETVVREEFLVRMNMLRIRLWKARKISHTIFNFISYLCLHTFEYNYIDLISYMGPYTAQNHNSDTQISISISIPCIQIKKQTSRSASLLTRISTSISSKHFLINICIYVCWFATENKTVEYNVYINKEI